MSKTTEPKTPQEFPIPMLPGYTITDCGQVFSYKGRNRRRLTSSWNSHFCNSPSIALSVPGAPGRTRPHRLIDLMWIAHHRYIPSDQRIMIKDMSKPITYDNLESVDVHSLPDSYLFTKTARPARISSEEIPDSVYFILEYEANRGNLERAIAGCARMYNKSEEDIRDIYTSRSLTS